jgi:hypothetical protein
MGDKIIITDEDEKPAPDVVVVKPEVVVKPAPRTEKVVTEKTTVTETKAE